MSLSLITIFFCTLVVAALVQWLHYNLTRKTPGPWGWPVVFSMPDFSRAILNNRILDLLDQYRETYGTTFQYRILGVGTMINVSESKDVTHILSDAFDNYVKPNMLRMFMESMFGHGIFVVSGPEWAEQRKTGSLGFKVREIRRSVALLEEDTNTAVELLKLEKPDTPIDVLWLTSSITLSSFTKLALSEQLANVTIRPEDEVNQFAKAFNEAMYCLSLRFANPLFQLTPFVSSERRLKSAVSKLDDIIHGIVEKAQQRNEDDGIDMLHNFAHMPGMSKSYLRDILLNFILAGRDTTAISLAFALYYLAENPSAQSALFDEVRSVLPPGQSPDFDKHLDQKLPYLTAVIKETLRLAPPVPVDPKEALCDDVLPSGHQVRAGYIVEWCQWNMSRATKFWGPDALKFRPERWLTEDLPKTNRPPWAPFQYGPRVCLGMRAALCGLEASIMTFVNSFEVFCIPGKTPIASAQVTLQCVPGHNIQLTFRERK